MGFVIGLLIGLAVGAAIAYFLGANKVSTQSAKLQDLKRQLDLAESEHERRLREATSQLQDDYHNQLRAAKAQLTKTQAAKASTQPPQAAVPRSVVHIPPTPSARTTPPPLALVSPPPATNQPTTPMPQPAVAPPAPDVVAPPITATAPAPIPQPASPSPNLPKAPSAQSAPSIAKSTATDDPNALLADSYAPAAKARCQATAAIAERLSTAGPQEQARWLPILGRLARDADADVRLQAVQAIAQLKSPKRLPLLQRALRDTDPAVVEAASKFLSQSKGRSLTPPKSPKRRLPKNH
jgi:gas vesicle protein